MDSNLPLAVKRLPGLSDEMFTRFRLRCHQCVCVSCPASCMFVWSEPDPSPASSRSGSDGEAAPAGARLFVADTPPLRFYLARSAAGRSPRVPGPRCCRPCPSADWPCSSLSASQRDRRTGWGCQETASDRLANREADPPAWVRVGAKNVGVSCYVFASRSEWTRHERKNAATSRK